MHFQTPAAHGVSTITADAKEFPSAEFPFSCLTLHLSGGSDGSRDGDFKIFGSITDHEKFARAAAAINEVFAVEGPKP